MACSPAAGAPRTAPPPASCSCGQSFPSMPSRQCAPMLPIAPMLPSRKQQVSAPAAAAACSSSKGLNEAPHRTTDPVRHGQSSGSTPHDPDTSDQRELPSLFLLAYRPPYLGPHASRQFSDNCTRNHLAQPTVHSFAAACSFSREQNTVSTCRALTSPASPLRPNPHSLCGTTLPRRCFP